MVTRLCSAVLAHARRSSRANQHSPGYGIFYTAYEGLSAGIMSANPPYGYTYTSAAPPLFAFPLHRRRTPASMPVSDFPLQKVAYGASRANPNSTVDWSQFEPLVGIPAVDPQRCDALRRALDGQPGAPVRTTSLVTLSYVGASSHHLLVLEEANPADPTLCLSLGSACGPFNEQSARTQFGPAFGSVELQRTIANAAYNALEATINHRSHGIETAGQLHVFQIHRPIRWFA